MCVDTWNTHSILECEERSLQVIKAKLISLEVDLELQKALSELLAIGREDVALEAGHQLGDVLQ